MANDRDRKRKRTEAKKIKSTKTKKDISQKDIHTHQEPHEEDTLSEEERITLDIVDKADLEEDTLMAEEKNPAMIEEGNDMQMDDIKDSLDMSSDVEPANNFGSKNAESNTLLQYFWDLASLDAQIRQKATLSMATYLQGCQSAFTPSSNATPASKEGDSAAALGEHCAPEVQYAIQRLVRGLTSSRRGARQGFALALTEILASVCPEVPTSLLLDLMKSHTKISAGMKGIEERDMLFGRVFFFSALLRSGLLLNAKACTSDDLTNTLEAMIGLSVKKPYLRECVFDGLMHVAKEVYRSFGGLYLTLQISKESPLYATWVEALNTRFSVAQKLFFTGECVALTALLQKQQVVCDFEYDVMFDHHRTVTGHRCSLRKTWCDRVIFCTRKIIP